MGNKGKGIKATLTYNLTKVDQVQGLLESPGRQLDLDL
jgi:hypothetical protein